MKSLITLLTILFSFSFGDMYYSGNNSSIIPDQETSITNTIVIQPCSMSVGEVLLALNNIDVEEEKQLLAIDTCRGEYRHCGNNVWRCPRSDNGLFGCCHHPSSCPSNSDLEVD